ncbi:MAG: FAD-binding protein [Hamadaea sp.]|nr:FAD-binding protein [Hamadaea sp.]NUT04088.1 FAD-binding protein [Hamadaea sp.]
MDTVIIVGAGPTGLTAALELANHGIPTILFDSGDLTSPAETGSRAIAVHRTALTVWERLGCAEPMLAEGVAWRTRHTFRGTREILTQVLPPAAGGLPTFLNLQQYRTEHHLLAAARAHPLVELRPGHRVIAVRQDRRQVTLEIQDQTGTHSATAAYVLACDGARGTMRRALGLDFPGQTFPDRFLIADLRVELDLPPEPRFYFDHPAHPGSTVLIHPQPFGVWRVDWQLGADVDVAAETTPERMDARIRALLAAVTGTDLDYDLVWLSDYRFHQRLLTRLRHRRVFFLGDSGHLVAPFGARGMNGAVQDVENLGWKLAAVLHGHAPEALLESYQDERWAAQEHNRQVVSATMRFMAPRTRWQRLRRDTILRLAARWRRAAQWVDSGRMSEPYRYAVSTIVLPDDGPARRWRGAPELGGKAPDADFVRRGRPTRLRHYLGREWVALWFTGGHHDGWLPAEPGQVPCRLITVDPADAGELGTAYAARPGTLYLIRPDGHIAARRRNAGPGVGRTLLDVMGMRGPSGAHLADVPPHLPQQRGQVRGDVDELEAGLDPVDRGPGV